MQKIAHMRLQALPRLGGNARRQICGMLFACAHGSDRHQPIQQQSDHNTDAPCDADALLG